MNAVYRIAVLSAVLLLPVFSAKAVNGDEDSHVRAVQHEKNSTKRFWRLYNLGEYYLLNNIEKADSIRDYVLAASRSENDSARLQALIFDLKIDQLRGNRPAYYTKILQLQPFLSRLKSRQSQIQIFHFLSDYHIAYREFAQAEFLLTEALQTAKKIRSYSLVGETCRLIALLKMEQNNKADALNDVDQAIQYSRRSSDKALLASCFNMQSKIYNYFGQVELSVSKNLIALQLAKEAGDSPKVANYQRELGEIQYSIYNYDDAGFYFAQSKEIAERIYDKRLVGLAKTDLGLVSFARREYPRAITLLRDAIKTLQRYNDDDGLGFAHMYLGNVYREIANYNEALRYYNKALVYFESAANRAEIASVYHLVGTVFEKQGKYANALNYLQRAVEIRSQFGYKGGVYPSYRAIAEVYQKTGNIKQAYHYLEMYSDYSDSASMIEISARIAEISELYRSEQRERLIAMQADSIELQRRQRDLTSAELENTELRNIFQTYVIIGFLLLVILGVVIFYNRWKQRNIKQLQREAEMSQTLLRSQMNPHFVFNSLNSIGNFILKNEPMKASTYLTKFSKLVRLIFDSAQSEWVTLEQEIKSLELYIELEQLRFNNKFDVIIHVSDDINRGTLMVPPLLLQPFAENAIWHGLMPKEGERGELYLHYWLNKDRLCMSIEDNGIGRAAAIQSRAGRISTLQKHGLKLTDERIQIINEIYHAQLQAEIKDLTDDQGQPAGTRVILSMGLKQ